MMLSHPWLIIGGIILCNSSSTLVEATRRLKFQREPENNHENSIKNDNDKEEWENIFNRGHSNAGRIPPTNSIAGKNKDNNKNSHPVKKKDDRNTSSPTRSPPSETPTKSPVHNNKEITITTESNQPTIHATTTSFPSSSPTIQPSSSLPSASATHSNHLQSIPLLDFQISFSHSNSSSLLEMTRLTESMETTLQLGMVSVAVEEIQFATIPIQVDSWTFGFSGGNAIVLNNSYNNTSLEDILQAQQIELLSDLSFVETALQHEMKDPTLQVDTIQILQHSDMLPSATGMITTENDNSETPNGMIMVVASFVCLLTFCVAAALCYRRYHTIKET